MKREISPLVRQQLSHTLDFFFFLQNIVLQRSSCTVKDIRAFLGNGVAFRFHIMTFFLRVRCSFTFQVDTQNMCGRLSGGSGMCTIDYLPEHI